MVAMNDMIRKSWLRIQDRSPSKSPTKVSPMKFSPSRMMDSCSPLKLKKSGNGEIVSPKKGNPFKDNMDSPVKKFKLREVQSDGEELEDIPVCKITNMR